MTIVPAEVTCAGCRRTVHYRGAAEREIDHGRSFADYPVSVTEARSDRTESGADWTPRDALIDMLRQIDSGQIAPDHLVIMWSATIADAVETHSSFAGPHILISLGLIDRERFRMHLTLSELNE